MARQFEMSFLRRGRTWSNALGTAVALVSSALVWSATPAQAESAFGCYGLAASDALPSIEGAGGQFFRIAPDLSMFHRVSDVSLDQVAALSHVLAQSGTTLVLLPMPTKALALPDALPAAASRFGYNPDIAASLYDMDIARYTAAGLAVVNARQGLRRAHLEGTQTYFQADYRMTPSGARALAGAVAERLRAVPVFETLPKTAFPTAQAGRDILPSLMSLYMQRRCSAELPPVEADRFRSSVLAGGAQLPGASLFEAAEMEGSVALVGTEQTGERLLHFAGFLAEASGLNVAEYHVPEGGPFAAISSYLTSAAFERTKPDFLLWEFPVWDNLGQFGEQPIAELIAAAGSYCTAPLPTAKGVSPDTVHASLAGLDLAQTRTIVIDTGGAPAFFARFSFARADGTAFVRTIYRHEDQRPTSRFYMPTEAIALDGSMQVSVQIDTDFGAAARVIACSGEGES